VNFLQAARPLRPFADGAKTWTIEIAVQSAARLGRIHNHRLSAKAGHVLETITPGIFSVAGAEFTAKVERKVGRHTAEVLCNRGQSNELSRVSRKANTKQKQRRKMRVLETANLSVNH
jgi:hypothetical protein